MPQWVSMMANEASLQIAPIVAEMVGESLQLDHQRAQPLRARRRGYVERRLCRLREGDGVGDGAVA
jgi:hypothetical protein